LNIKLVQHHVYHFVSKTSRVGNYQDGEIKSNQNFVKKWGFRKSTHNVVYNKKCIINNSNPELNEALNWWFNDGEDIIVEIDGNTFTQQDYTYIQQLNDIIKETNDIGVFAIGNIKLTINKLEEQQHKYLRL
jgi:hypothetical protein